MIKLLIADDHPVVRAGLEGMLASEPDFELVGSVADGEAAIAQIVEHQPDVALIDLRMPKQNGVETLERLRAHDVATRVLILTTYDTDADIARALDAGACGYLLKDTPRRDLFDAIRRVARGERVLSPGVAERMRKRADEALSPRELEVLTWLARGESNRAIARHLFISEATVKTHLIHIFGKLRVSQRTAAVTEALRLGIIRLE